MRVFSTSGPIVLALGAALVGCGQPGDTPPKASSNPSTKAPGTAPAKNAASYDYVLGIDGMT